MHMQGVFTALDPLGTYLPGEMPKMARSAAYGCYLSERQSRWRLMVSLADVHISGERERWQHIPRAGDLGRRLDPISS
jgi:hypothetical protein